MLIVETPDSVLQLINSIRGKTTYWYTVWVDNHLHPLNTPPSFFYIRCGETDYILPHNHGDTLSIDLDTVSEVLNTEGISWVFQKKKLLHTLKTTKSEIYDIDTAHFLKTGDVIDYGEHFEKLESKWIRLGYREDLMKSIPIFKLGEIIETIINNYTEIDNTDYNFNWYDSVYIPRLVQMEQYGVRVDINRFREKWPNLMRNLTSEGRIYTEYNPFTVTGRPSNRHGGINFSALNKRDGTRKIFVSEGIFIQMDYDSYHPRIIGKLIDFELPKTSVHKWLSEQYGTSYDEGKGVTFQILYGGIPDEFLEIPYYRSVQDYIDKLWKDTQNNGYLRTLYRRIPLSWISDPTPQKVFNYQLQGVETEMNIDRISDIIKTIDGTDIRFVFYTYDSFLFDHPVNMDISLAKKLKDIIENNQFPVKVSWGTDYSVV